MWPHLPRTLVLAATRGDLNVLVGAGVSADAGLPDWNGILLALARGLEPAQKQQVARLVQSSRNLDAAQLLREYLTPSELAALLFTELGKKVEPSPIHEAIWSLRAPLVMTTNFDALLEAAYAGTAHRQASVILGSEGRPRADGTPSGTIFKMHGDLGVPESLVLARNDYYKLMGTILTERNSPWAEFARRPCLGLGYSLRDPDIQLLCGWTNSSLRGFAQPIYLVVPEQPPEEAALLRSLGNVVLLEYPRQKAHRAAVLELLDMLVSQRARHLFASEQSTAERALLNLGHLEARAALHELNNRLGVALPLLDLIAEYLEANPHAHSAAALDDARAALEALRQGRRAVIDCQQSLASAMQHSDPATWRRCRSSLADSLANLPAGIAIKQRVVRDAEGTLPVGPNLYALLVRILIINAQEALQSTPRPSITLTVNVSTYSERAYLITTVTDNGPGLDKSIGRRLFSPGISTKGGGRGNGLFLLASVAEESGGDVSVTSTERKGTIARLRLPFIATTAGTAIAGQAPSAPNGSTRSKSGRLHAVCVEDDPRSLKRLAQLLAGRLDCQVSTYLSSRTALTRIRKRKRAPDLVVTDVVMPGLSGYDLAEGVREKFPYVPILFVSGYLAETRWDGIPDTEFLMKPYEEYELAAALHRLAAIPPR